MSFFYVIFVFFLVIGVTSLNPLSNSPRPHFVPRVASCNSPVSFPSFPLFSSIPAGRHVLYLPWGIRNEVEQVGWARGVVILFLLSQKSPFPIYLKHIISLFVFNISGVSFASFIRSLTFPHFVISLINYSVSFSPSFHSVLPFTTYSHWSLYLG